MHMALDRTLRPSQGKPGLHRLVVFLERLGKAAEFRNTLLFYLSQLGIKAFPFPFAQHGGKFLDEFIGLADLLVSFA